MKAFFFGKTHWTRAPKYRTLAQPVDPRKFTLADAWHPQPVKKEKTK